MTVGSKVLIALVALTGTAAGTYAVKQVIARRRPRVGAPPPRAPKPPASPVLNYVGSGWTAWPHKDVFPDQDAIVQALRRLGYTVDDDLITARSMVQVGRFQEDYNTWSTVWYEMDPDALWPEDPASPWHPVDVDELMGHETVGALYDALLADDIFPGGWQALVDWYAAQA